MSEIFQQYGKEIVSLVVPFIAWFLNSALKGKAKLVFAQPHQWIFKVDEPLKDAAGNVLQSSQTAHTRSFVVRNTGREAARNIEVVLNYKPLSVNVWPSRDYSVKTAPDGRFIVSFPSLAPGEMLGCEVLTINQELPNLVGVRSETSVAQQIEMRPQQVFGRPFQLFVALLMLAGMISLTYGLLQLLQFLLVKTP